MEFNSKKKLRIGILTNKLMVPAWFYSMISRINDSDYAEIVLVVEKTNSHHEQKSLFQKFKDNPHLLAHTLYWKLEDKVFKPKPFAFEEKNLLDLISLAPVLKINVIEKKHSDIIQRADIEKILPFEIDVFIQSGFRIIRGDILKVPKNGIWSYHHGDNQQMRGGPAGVWESTGGWREIGCVLQILTDDLDNGKILYRSWSQTELISFNRTLNTVYWKGVSFVPRKLQQLHSLGAEEFDKQIVNENQDIFFYSNRLFKAPGNTHFISKILKQYFRWLKKKCWFWFHFEQWILLYHFEKEEKISTSIFKYKRLTPPKDRFWADPFVLYRNDKYYIFFEELIYKQRNGKAHIALIEMDEQGVYTQPRAILKRDYHLSYPFVFDYKGTLYMIPETMENSTIELYKCTSFPDKWEFVMNLMENVKAVDTTIFEKDGKVWMFTNITENKGASSFDELFLFYADDLLTSQWTAHPKNPIVSDVKSARPAGPLFYYNDKLYRPSQDCSYRYGYATVINEITELNTTAYKEQPVNSILPNWDKDVVATHAITHAKKLTVIDALVKRWK